MLPEIVNDVGAECGARLSVLVPCSGPRQVVPLYVIRNVTLSIGVPSPFSENGQLSEPRVSEPVTTIGIVAPPRRPVTVPLNTSPTPHSAENRPEASVAVWVVTDHVKFEQLEKSGTVTEVVEDVDAGGDVPWTTQVPSIDGIEEFPVDEDVLVVGPSTVEVRSTPHAATAIATASELDRKRDLFFMDVIFGYRTTDGRPIPVYLQDRPCPDTFSRSRGQPQELALAIVERRPESFTKLATVDIESTASFCASRTKVVARLRQFVSRLPHCS